MEQGQKPQARASFLGERYAGYFDANTTFHSESFGDVFNLITNRIDQVKFPQPEAQVLLNDFWITNSINL